MAVPGLFQRPPYFRAPLPLNAVFTCLRLVIRQAVNLKRKLRAPGARSGFPLHARPTPYANTPAASDFPRPSSQWSATAAPRSRLLQTNQPPARTPKKDAAVSPIRPKSAAQTTCVAPAFAEVYR